MHRCNILKRGRLLIHTFSVLSLQLKKLRWHNKSAIDLSNANPACGHKEVRRSTGHIMVTTRYSDQQGSKSRQKVMRLYKRWHRPISKRFIKPPYSIREQPRSTRNVVAYPRPAFEQKYAIRVFRTKLCTWKQRFKSCGIPEEREVSNARTQEWALNIKKVE